MPHIVFRAMPTAEARHYQSGGADAYGQPPERHVSDGDGVPCRHCLSDVAAGEAYLILAYRPFPVPQPYAETGPIFLHAGACARAPESDEPPPSVRLRHAQLLKGYSADHRIVYGTGKVVPTADIVSEAAAILAREDVAYVHARSARNNCYTCRIDRA